MQNDETYLLDILESAKIAVGYLKDIRETVKNNIPPLINELEKIIKKKK